MNRDAPLHLKVLNLFRLGKGLLRPFLLESSSGNTALEVKLVEALLGRPCSDEELLRLSRWAEHKVNRTARVLKAIAKPEGFLVQLQSESTSPPQWHAVCLDDPR